MFKTTYLNKKQKVLEFSHEIIRTIRDLQFFLTGCLYRIFYFLMVLLLTATSIVACSDNSSNKTRFDLTKAIIQKMDLRIHPEALSESYNLLDLSILLFNA